MIFLNFKESDNTTMLLFGLFAYYTATTWEFGISKMSREPAKIVSYLIPQSENGGAYFRSNPDAGS
jgi:hypothetical protein